jgi:hypothetical protein
MLRLQYLVEGSQGRLRIVEGAAPGFGRLQLVGAYRVAATRAEIFQTMGQRSFDPAREVILESAPHPSPVNVAAPGRAAIVREGTDFIDIVAELTAPSILLITDAWASGWRARALEGSAQQHYEVMPADYALRAIPLDKGRHHLRVEYAPLAFRLGAAVSVLAWLGWLAALNIARRQHAR